MIATVLEAEVVCRYFEAAVLRVAACDSTVQATVKMVIREEKPTATLS